MRTNNRLFVKGITFLTVVIFTQILLVSCGRQHPRSAYRSSDDEGWIGVYAQDLDDELRRYLDINERNGVLVNDVLEESPAEKAGLREEDVIVKFDGRRIRNTKDLTRAVERTEPRSRVKVEIVRNNNKRTLNLRVGEKPQEYYSYRYRTKPRSPRVFSRRGSRRPWLGVQMANLNQDLAAYFNVNERAGVLILSVVEDSPAENGGLKAGDVILKIDGERVTKTNHVSDIISDYESGDEVEIEIKRKGKNKKVKVELESSSWRSYYDFDSEELEDWKRDIRRWKDDMEEWKYGLKEWERNFDKDRIYDMESEIRREIEESILNGIDIAIPELEYELEGIGEEIEKEMRRLNEELRNLRIELRVDEGDKLIL